MYLNYLTCLIFRHSNNLLKTIIFKKKQQNINIFAKKQLIKMLKLIKKYICKIVSKTVNSMITFLSIKLKH